MADELLDLLEPSDRDDLLAIGRRVRAARGQALLAQGQVPDRVLVLLDGRVKVTATTPAGHDAVLAFRGPGALLGEQALFDGAPRSAGVVGVEPVEALSLEAGAFRVYLERRPRVMLLLLGLMSARLRDADRKRIDFGHADTTGRVCARLLELAEDHGEATDGGGVRIVLPITQEDLAAWSGASIEAAVKALRTLRELGWIETGRRSYVIRDADALRRRSA
ncbi:MAG: family transcriptional regulator, cyclic receptor protein [Thermoleophilaceae bacterium]|nr:family transcriptional regulator, cyclic receptor protein [Thermoleophilaceae bacterium]